MPVSPVDFISFAKICVTGKDEISYRNAIARSYYAAYHTVCPLMLNGPKDSHQGLINYLHGDAQRGFESYAPNSLRALGHALQSLKDQRIACDYDLADDFDESDANTVIRTAEKLILRCASI